MFIEEVIEIRLSGAQTSLGCLVYASSSIRGGEDFLWLIELIDFWAYYLRLQLMILVLIFISFKKLSLFS